MSFRFRALSWNVVFGAGALARLADEVHGLGCRRALVLTTPRQVVQGQRILAMLGESGAGLFDGVAMHVPSTAVAGAIDTVKRTGADCAITYGGGSATGLGKALARELGLPNIAVPTTFAGSEMTNIWGITQDGRKTTGRDDRVLPRLVVYDPELTLAVPLQTLLTSGLNALAQAAVNVATARINPVVSAMGQEAVRLLAGSLPQMVGNPADLPLRSDALYGAALAGTCLGAGETSLHHRLCHTLGGTFNTPHAETHAVLLPHSIEYNTRYTQAGSEQLARAMGVQEAAAGIYDLARAVRAPATLQEIGVKAADLDRVAAIVAENPPDNPAPVTASGVRELLERAYQGIRPGNENVPL